MDCWERGISLSQRWETTSAVQHSMVSLETSHTHRQQKQTQRIIFICMCVCVRVRLRVHVRVCVPNIRVKKDYQLEIGEHGRGSREGNRGWGSWRKGRSDVISLSINNLYQLRTFLKGSSVYLPFYQKLKFSISISTVQWAKRKPFIRHAV